MDKDGIKNLMSNIAHFDELNNEEVNLLADCMEYRKVDSGTFLIEEGQVGNSLYYIASGKVEISMESLSEENRTIAERGKGSTIGEMALVGMSNIRTATVTAVTDTELLVLSKKAYANLMENHPKTALKILKGIAAHLCRRVKELSGQVVDFL